MQDVSNWYSFLRNSDPKEDHRFIIETGSYKTGFYTLNRLTELKPVSENPGRHYGSSSEYPKQ